MAVVHLPNAPNGEQWPGERSDRDAARLLRLQSWLTAEATVGGLRAKQATDTVSTGGNSMRLAYGRDDHVNN